MATTKKLMTLLSLQGLTKNRGAIISELTNGRTSSVRALTPDEVDYLCSYFEERKKLADANLDKKRKRLLASIFGMFKKMNKQVSIEYVKAIACRGAKVKDFNEITETRLDSMYNAYIHAQKDLEFSKRLVSGYITEQQYYN